MARKLAGREGIPTPALSKTLQRLARRGLLESVRGRGGGFCLARSPREITIADIVEAIDGRAVLRRCSLGYSNCRPQDPCYVDRALAEARTAFRSQLSKITLHDLARTRTFIRRRKSRKRS